ncbi:MULTISPECIES: hypothetical protein [Clostridium]|uniref:hypothetical protein n=1 Tax=Clostridium TaxID=1485 RepID=UPI00061F3EE0|nr:MULTISPECIES: hypothetical protein [Clostridium]KJZ95378.1 hypothetical protein ClosIBUN62F_CONTIG14g00721 [Clostridium sp. IBUN62F]KJZ96915.1 hypothetical protein ClosIBUN22A_CONTIG100g02074 [Clostridium sp. IBUN22A]MBS5983874.1 hypothetical protein [Clostridium butyricum]
MSIDMLEVKKDRLKEVKKQIVKYSKKKNWSMVYPLMKEQRELKDQIKNITACRSKVK